MFFVLIAFELRFVNACARNINVVVVVGSLKTACSIKDYCSPVLCLGAKQKTPSPSLVAFYDTPGKVWAASIFFVALPAGHIYLTSFF